MGPPGFGPATTRRHQPRKGRLRLGLSNGGRVDGATVPAGVYRARIAGAFACNGSGGNSPGVGTHASGWERGPNRIDTHREGARAEWEDQGSAVRRSDAGFGVWGAGSVAAGVARAG